MKEKRAKPFPNAQNLSKLFKNDENGHNSTHTHPNHTFLTGNSMPRPGEGLGHGPGPKKYKKICKIRLFGPFLGRLTHRRPVHHVFRTTDLPSTAAPACNVIPASENRNDNVCSKPKKDMFFIFFDFF